MWTTQNKCQSRGRHWFVLALIFISRLVFCSGFVPKSLPLMGQDRMTIRLASTSSKTTTTSMPPRKAKHRKSRHKKSNRRATGQSLSQQQVAHHVAHAYLDDKFKKTDHKNLNRHPALVLNADYQPMSCLPLSIWHWQESVKAVFSGKVTVVNVYEDVVVRAASLEIPLPSVIALNEYVPQFHQRPAFTKRNVFLRDEYRCQYCSQNFHTRDLSLDHVVPRCQGGRLSWQNAVTSCHSCNTRKGSLKVQQLPKVGMKLQREPFVPTQFQLAAIAGRMLPRRVHPTWAPYLGMEQEEAMQQVSLDKM